MHNSSVCSGLSFNRFPKADQSACRFLRLIFHIDSDAVTSIVRAAAIGLIDWTVIEYLMEKDKIRE